MSGPRQGPGPRTGSGPRAPVAARRVGTSRSRCPARASHDAAAAVAPAAEQESDAISGAAALAPGDELSNWRLLLQQLDALLRDPTLTRALAASAARLAAAVRGLSAATSDAIRRLAQALRRILLRFPRRVLLALLALLLPLALLAVLTGADGERDTRSATEQPALPPAGDVAGASLPGVGMPDVRLASARVPPVRVALVVDRTYDAAELRRELRALGGWLGLHHAPGTRVSVIDARSARASGPLRAGDLSDARLGRRRPSTAAATRSAFAGGKGRRLLVTLGTAPPPSTASTLRIATRRGAGTRSSAPLRGRRRSSATIDDRRPNALAASVARGIMAVSGQREQR